MTDNNVIGTATNDLENPHNGVPEQHQRPKRPEQEVRRDEARPSFCSVVCSRRVRRILWGMVGCVFLVVMVLFFIWLVTRPENIDITQAPDDMDSPLEFVKAGRIENTESGMGILGTVALSMSFRTGNKSSISFWVDVVLDGDDYPETATLPIDFFFVDSLQDNSFGDNSTTFDVSDLRTTFYQVETIDNATLPYRLDESFDPNLYMGGIFVDANNVIVGRVSFTIDSGSSAPLILVSQIRGAGGYDTSGTITLGVRSELVNGQQVVETPYMILENIKPPRAPGPYLYLSTDRRWSRDDVFLALEGVEGGSYTKVGSFVQDLPEDLDLEMFRSGYFIVWCRPFRVTLGRGSISVQE